MRLGEIIRLAAACKKPNDTAMEAVLLPLSKDIEAVTRAKEQFRKDRDWNSHHTVLAEGAPIVGWVAVVSKPRQACNGLYSSLFSSLPSLASTLPVSRSPWSTMETGS